MTMHTYKIINQHNDSKNKGVITIKLCACLQCFTPVCLSTLFGAGLRKTKCATPLAYQVVMDRYKIKNDEL